MREFLAEHVLAPADAWALDAELNLLEAGILESLTVTNLVAELERRFGFAVTPAEFEPEQFESVRSIRDFVERKLGAT